MLFLVFQCALTLTGGRLKTPCLLGTGWKPLSPVAAAPWQVYTGANLVGGDRRPEEGMCSACLSLVAAVRNAIANDGGYNNLEILAGKDIGRRKVGAAWDMEATTRSRPIRGITHRRGCSASEAQ